jgi:16S rRNA (cytosine1402-N4)-methyltransferase
LSYGNSFFKNLMTIQHHPTEATTPSHTPFLLQEVLEALNLKPGLTYVDATLGLGGHALAISQQLHLLAKQSATPPKTTLLGIDQDAQAIAIANQHLSPKNNQTPSAIHFQSWQGNYSQLKQALQETQIPLITGGILLDLGVSSLQLDEATRGFSFLRQGPLDMRMSAESDQETAQTLINTWPEKDLAHCFYTYGEERFSHQIAKAICSDRQQTPFTNTTQLAQLIERIYKSQQRHKGIKKEDKHPATRVFQALRIAVNNELTHLEKTLEQLPETLAPQAIVAIITFHSLEDRLVKQWFKQACASCLCPPRWPICQCNQTPTFQPIYKKPLTASPQETNQNPRARSAKLRIYQRL